jgi:DNA primase
MVVNRKELVAIKEYANEKIERILDALNVDYEERYKYIVAPCPIHGGDRQDAFSWHMEYGMFQCFSKGCHEKYGKDVFGLVRGVRECSFPEAVNFVKALVDAHMVDVNEIYQHKENKTFVAREVKKTPKVYPESMLDRLSYNDYLETRDYPKELVLKYQAGVPSIKYGRMSNRIVFPIRNIDGGIVGFTGRTLRKDWHDLKIGKWEHSAGFDKEHNLFNIDRAKDAISKSGVAIICEGPLDVLRLEQAGIHNGVAIFGRKLHNGQISLLIQAGANKIVVALDGDAAGRSGAESALITAKNFFSVSAVDLGDGDVGDLAPSKVLEIFSEKCSR